MERRASTDGPAEAAGPADEALLRLFAKGDPQAARDLTGRLGPRAFSVALRVLGNRAEAEDVAQEAMLRLWRMAPEWEPGRARVSTWLYRVTLNLCLDRKRRAQAVDLGTVPEPPDEAPPAIEVLQQAARVDALQAALMHLPDRQRQAVVLRHFEELANPEIAEIMGIGVEAVESLTARGKRALAGQLAGQRAALGYDDDG
ncbi:RNA polymerase sigma factor [Ruegeria sp. 1NDH52C]|uniref:RNA polymerase sigma factor n=1 Tax=Ruegeria alba TaxID=2916756 RepID=A0ABS9NU17_9RHOB|nr:RNA polymerase sigma factor [Ruegeria alba]MCG6557714.1 RNA polymerase sigma factor [Ruegeria alba]